MYAKLINNKLQYAPKNYNTGDNLILNFNKNINLMKQHGFKEVIDNKPSYDNSTHYLSVDSYTESDVITINYKLNEIVVDNTPTLEQRVTKLEKLTQEQFKIIQELQLIKE